MTKYKLREIIELNPRESIKKGNIARKIAMDDLGEFKRDIEKVDGVKVIIIKH